MRIPRRFLASLIATALLTMTATPEMSRAESEIEQVAPNVLIQRQRQTIQSQWHHSIYWDLALPHPKSSYIEFVQVDGNSKKMADSILCNGYDDPICAPRQNTYISSVATLGRCLGPDEVACIEGIRLRVGTEEMADLEFVSYMTSGMPKYPDTVFSESTALNLPRGSWVSMWKDRTGSEYAVDATISTVLNFQNGAWVISPTSGQNAVINVSRLPGPSCTCRSELVMSPAQLVFDPSSPTPYKSVSFSNPRTPTIEFKPSTRIELAIRLPDTITGWFNGRISSGSVTARPLANNRTSYTFAADASPTYIAGGAVATTAVPADFVTKQMGGSWPYPFAELAGTPGYPGTIDKYKLWLPYIGEKALGTQSRWTILGTGWTAGTCFSGGKGISALLATNAAVYDGSPPTWDSTTKSLSFKVASPHYDDKGAVAVGNYTLALPSAAVSCLYGRASLPLYAKIEVTESKDGQNFSAVSALSESGGWVNFSASGFHFSEPTIKLTFTDNPTGAGQGLDVYLAKDKAETSVAPARFVKTTIKGRRATVSITLDKAQTVKIYRKTGKKITLLKTLKARKGMNTFSTPYKASYSFLVRDARGKVITPLASSSSFTWGARHVI